MTRALTIGACVLFACGGAAADEDTLGRRIDALASPFVEDERVVGMSVGVAIGDRVVFRGYGRMSARDDTTPDERTVYEIGSITKTFTGVLLADAVLRDEVKLDDPVASHLSDSVKIPTRSGKAITLAQLSMHTSGLPRMPSNFAPADASNPYADYTPLRMFTFLAGHKLRRDPGATREYSNLGVGLLGHTLARRADTTYEQLMIDRIAGPLGMTDTTIALSADQQRRLAPPHNADGEPASNWDIPTLAGAGAVRSTAADMMRYLRAHVDAAGEADDSQLAGAMRSAMKVRLTDARGGMGLGWHIARDGVTRWHNGQTGGYHSYGAVLAEKKIAVVVLSHTATGAVDKLGEQLVRLAFGQNPQPIKAAPTVKVPVATLQGYTGVYALTPAFMLTVTREGDRLYVRATGQQRFRVFPTSPTEFRYRVVDARITFIPAGPDDKPPARLILHQHGRDMPAVRVENAP